MTSTRRWLERAVIGGVILLALAQGVVAQPAAGVGDDQTTHAQAVDDAAQSQAAPLAAPAASDQPAQQDPGEAAQVEHPAGTQSADAHAASAHAKHSPHPAWIIPFAVMLLSIALFPLFAPHWWEHRYPWVAAMLFCVGLLYYAAVRRDLHPWLHEMREYVSFISLLFALFVVSGGIAIHVSRRATPSANVVLLFSGAILANLFGTTGAAMLLIRPYIRMNRAHIKPYHIIFFIFIIANVGGCLTPIGDPPLFLGYLKGVPFWWVLQHCWQPWLVANALLLGVFFIIDKLDHAKVRRDEPPEHDSGPAVRINGVLNFVLILLVVVAVFRPSVFDAAAALMEGGVTPDKIFHLLLSREVLMVATALASLRMTHRGVYEQNEFTFTPIREVAILFLAIFSTMVPALEYLDANADRLPLRTPGNFYFATGSLSSVLDNAPTYLTFLQARLGAIPQEQVDQIQQITDEIYLAYEQDPSLPLVSHIPEDVDPQVRQALYAVIRYHADDIISHKGHVDPNELKLGFLIGVPELNAYLIAISIGAVFFGAFTYIGNAPNFMVKSIAEASGIKMPTFLGYVVRFAVPILLPVLVIIWAVFFLRHG
ncbi:MAG TPA: sodium:proton antiporter [Phycisphaeraceae bacterium]